VAKASGQGKHPWQRVLGKAKTIPRSRKNTTNIFSLTPFAGLSKNKHSADLSKQLAGA
jgi:hypothetical protein